MALKPFRQYADNDVVIFYSLNANSGDAGSVVTLSSFDLSDEDSYTTINWSPHAGTYVPTYQTNAKVALSGASGTLTRKEQVLGIMLQDVRTVDKNRLPLEQFRRRAQELDTAISGEAIAVLTRGIVLTNKWVATGSALNPGSGVIVATGNGDNSFAGSGLLAVQNTGVEYLIGKTLSSADSDGYVLIAVTL